AWDERTPLRDLLDGRTEFAGIDLDAVFDYGHFVRHSDAILARLDAIAASAESRPRARGNLPRDGSAVPAGGAGGSAAERGGPPSGRRRSILARTRRTRARVCPVVL